MFENYRIKKQLKNLRNKSVSEEFLALLRVRLTEFIDANSVLKTSSVKPAFGVSIFDYLFKMKLPIPFAMALVVVLAGGGVAAASQASLPGDRLFEVKILTEEVRTAFAFSAQSRASLQLKFTQERLEEIKEVLSERGIEPKGLEMAISRLESNSLRAADIVQEERSRGRSMDDLAGKVDESLNSLEQNLRQTFKSEEDKLKNQEGELKSKINEARQRGDQDMVLQLRSALGEAHRKREFLEQQRESAEDSLDRRQIELRRGRDDEREASEQRSDAQEAIRNAERERAELFTDAAVQGSIIPEVRLKEINDALSKARAAFEQNQFREAKNSARQSRNLSRDLEDQLFDSSGPGPSGRESEDRGREQEQRGREQELRGRVQEGETEVRGREQELRGREQEGEAEIRGQEQEVRGQESEQRDQEQEQRGQESEPGRDNGAGDNNTDDDRGGIDRGGNDGSSGRDGGEDD